MLQGQQIKKRLGRNVKSSTGLGEIRKERQEKDLGKGGQTIENGVNMRSAEFSQSPDYHLKAGSSGTPQGGVQRNLNPLGHKQGLNQSFLHFERLLQAKSCSTQGAEVQVGRELLLRSPAKTQVIPADVGGLI